MDSLRAKLVSHSQNRQTDEDRRARENALIRAELVARVKSVLYFTGQFTQRMSDEIVGQGKGNAVRATDVLYDCLQDWMERYIDKEYRSYNDPDNPFDRED